MKKIMLLSILALMLVGVFAPSAQAYVSHHHHHHHHHHVVPHHHHH
jgi:hypothetical protein